MLLESFSIFFSFFKDSTFWKTMRLYFFSHFKMPCIYLDLTHLKCLHPVLGVSRPWILLSKLFDKYFIGFLLMLYQKFYSVKECLLHNSSLITYVHISNESTYLVRELESTHTVKCNGKSMIAYSSLNVFLAQKPLILFQGFLQITKGSVHLPYVLVHHRYIYKSCSNIRVVWARWQTQEEQCPGHVP